MSLLTTTPLKAAPSAAVGLTVTSGGSAWANGSWVQFIASAPAALQIAGIVVGFTVENDEGEYDIGVGAASSEVAIATIRVTHGAPQNWSGLGVWMLPVPIDNVANGARVSIRCRGVATSTGRTVALQYYQGLDSDNTTAVATAALPAAAAGASITPNASSWVNSAWVQLTAGIAHEIALIGLTFKFVSAVEQEFDIGTGGSGSETVISTLRVKVGATKGALPQYANLPAPFPIAASTRIAVRLRKNDTNTSAVLVAATYYDNTTLLSQPSSVTITAPTLDGTGTETFTGTGSVTFTVPSLQGSSTITGTGDVSISPPSLDGSGTVTDTSNRVEISVPSLAGSGTVVVTGTGDVSIAVAGLAGSGSAPTTTPSWSTNRLYAAPPAATGISITPSSTSGAWSAWSVLDASTAAAWLLSSLVVMPDRLGPAATVDIEVGIGASGSEVVIDRFRGHWYTPAYASPGELPRPVLLDAIRAGSRVVLRMRKANTSVTPWHVSATYLRKPAAGVLLSSAKPQKTCPDTVGNQSLTLGSGAWGNGAWTTMTASTATAWLLTGIIPAATGLASDWEVDVGVGATPTVITTVRFHHTGIAPVDGPTVIPLYQPLSAIPAGSKVSMRPRHSAASIGTGVIGATLLYLELPL